MEGSIIHIFLMTVLCRGASLRSHGHQQLYSIHLMFVYLLSLVLYLDVSCLGMVLRDLVCTVFVTINGSSFFLSSSLKTGIISLEAYSLEAFITLTVNYFIAFLCTMAHDIKDSKKNRVV